MVDDQDIEGYITYNTYLENIASGGIHIWKFRCDKVEEFDIIAIRDVDSESLRLERYFDAAADAHKVVGYGFALDGTLTYIQDVGMTGDDYGQKCKDGDSILMCLDFENLTLKFKINNNDYDITS